MTGALVILLAMIVIGALLYVTDVSYFRHHHHAPEDKAISENRSDSTQKSGITENQDEFCCGQHLVCEKTSLSLTSDEIVYYDDEELDRFAGRDPESYTHEEIEEFRDVLLTLLPMDVAGWAKSISLRKIQLPYEVKDELLLIVSELRAEPSIV